MCVLRDAHLTWNFSSYNTNISTHRPDITTTTTTVSPLKSSARRLDFHFSFASLQASENNAFKTAPNDLRMDASEEVNAGDAFYGAFYIVS